MPVLINPINPANPTSRSIARKYERQSICQEASWDFFTLPLGKKWGLITDISEGGCCLKTSEEIEHRRWIRLIMRDGTRKMAVTLVGRIVRRENQLECHESPELESGGAEFTLYRYGIEFTFPKAMSAQDLDLIFALSSKNLTVRSCLTLNETSSLRSEFLA